jgi:hypothetical protein
MYSIQRMVHREILTKLMEKGLVNQGIEILLHMISMGVEQQGRQLLIRVLGVKAWFKIIARCYLPIIIEKRKRLPCNPLILS